MKHPNQRHKEHNPAPTWEEENQDWIRWWKRHRDSGYVEDPETGKGRYNIYPHEAFSVLKYQAERHGDCGLPFSVGKINGLHLPEFTAQDFENWAQRQKEFEDAGGNRMVSRHVATDFVQKYLRRP